MPALPEIRSKIARYLARYGDATLASVTHQDALFGPRIMIMLGCLVVVGSLGKIMMIIIATHDSDPKHHQIRLKCMLRAPAA